MKTPRSRRLTVALSLLVVVMAMVGAITLATTYPPREAEASVDSSAALKRPRTGFAIVRTAKVAVREGVLYAGGDFLKVVDTSFSAFLVKHEESLLLFDSGLGSNVDAQYRQDMPLWARPLFRYETPVQPARAQLEREKIPAIERIFLSHSHWDHASGLTDFPGATVWVPASEMEIIRNPASGAGGSWPSQVSSKAIEWRTLQFTGPAYDGFERSLDLFEDGKVVLVPLSGHTPGSVGMFVTVDSGKRYLFCGDVVWRADALREGRSKLWPASLIVDNNREATSRSVEQLRALVNKHPDLVVVPAHDGTVQGALGYFPAWVR